MDIKQSIRRNFARRAASYDRHAEVQRRMARDLLSRVQEVLPAPSRILEIGCGTGYLTAQLRQAYPQAQLVALDLDPALIGEARRRLGPDAKVSWLVADGEACSRGGFDLIIANATFQWFTRPGEALKSQAQALAPGGCLAFSTLGPRTFRELAAALVEAAQALNIPSLPEIPARGFHTLKKWEALLEQAGFSRVQSTREILEAYFANVPEFLQALKSLGATSPRPRAFTPRLLNALIRAYDSRFRQNGTIPVTYEIIWTLARK